MKDEWVFIGNVSIVDNHLLYYLLYWSYKGLIFKSYDLRRKKTSTIPVNHLFWTMFRVFHPCWFWDNSFSICPGLYGDKWEPCKVSACVCLYTLWYWALYRIWQTITKSASYYCFFFLSYYLSVSSATKMVMFWSVHNL